MAYPFRRCCDTPASPGSAHHKGCVNGELHPLPTKSAKQARDYLTGKFDRRSHPGGRCEQFRHDRIIAAGVTNDRHVLALLGSMEGYTWHEGRHLADPHHDNPYGMDRKL